MEGSNQTLLLSPCGMLAVTRFISPELWSEQICDMRYHNSEIAVCRGEYPVSPAFWQLMQYSGRHEIDVPAVGLLKLAANHRIIT